MDFQATTLALSGAIDSWDRTIVAGESTQRYHIEWIKQMMVKWLDQACISNEGIMEVGMHDTGFGTPATHIVLQVIAASSCDDWRENLLKTIPPGIHSFEMYGNNGVFYHLPTRRNVTLLMTEARRDLNAYQNYKWLITEYSKQDEVIGKTWRAVSWLLNGTDFTRTAYGGMSIDGHILLFITFLLHEGYVEWIHPIKFESNGPASRRSAHSGELLSEYLYFIANKELRDKDISIASSRATYMVATSWKGKPTIWHPFESVDRSTWTKHGWSCFVETCRNLLNEIFTVNFPPNSWGQHLRKIVKAHEPSLIEENPESMD